MESEIAGGQDGAQTAGDAAGAGRAAQRGGPGAIGGPADAGDGRASEAGRDGAGAGGVEKKVSGDAGGVLTGEEWPGEVVRHHQYGVQQVLVVVSLVVSAATS